MLNEVTNQPINKLPDTFVEDPSSGKTIGTKINSGIVGKGVDRKRAIAIVII